MGWETSCNGANFVARNLDWNMTKGWQEGNDATEAFFHPVETFRQRFTGLVGEVRGMGFTAMDVWTAQLHYRWSTPAHIRTAKDVLGAEGVSVPTMVGPFGETRDEFRKACELAKDLGASVLAGSTVLADTDRAFVLSTLDEFDLRLGLENHPREHTAADMLERISAPTGGRVGTTVDTGWYGTQGYDAAKAIRELAPYVFAVHLKDVRAAGAHDTCRFGDGVVPLEECVRALTDIGYGGPVSIEHEPSHYDPADELVTNREMLEAWLRDASVSR
jgi:L-ribulose-5-phosphate 3-epimerase